MQAGLKPLMVFDVQVGRPVDVDTTPGHGRRFIPITGGEVSGGYAGRVLEGGGDWQVVWPDGRLDISAHYIVEIDGALVEIHSDGVRTGSPEVLAQLARGESVDASRYYFRTAIRFRTQAPELAHLNGMLAVAYGARAQRGVHLEIFEVL